MGVLATFVRVNVALVIGAAWTIPAGVAIGLSPRLSRIAQPLAQIAASVPATALFPIVLLVLIRLGGGLGVASVILLLLGTQWYLLFNVIAGAIAIPTDLKEAAAVFKLSSLARWRKLILPGIFPYLVTGLVTASGGAWNASIIAEYFHFQGQVFSTVGARCGHQLGNRFWQFQSSYCIHNRNGCGRGDHQSYGLAQALWFGRDAIQTGGLIGE
jgi:NitT/TauT family transport system permease protein